MSDQKNSWFDKFFINELKAIAKNKTQAPSQPDSSDNNSGVKDVNFYDYDGTLLHSYTLEEAKALTELPPLPERDGLICQGWNYDLEAIKSHNRKLNIGAIYNTDDDKTRFYIRIPTDDATTVTISFSASGALYDWGDGSENTTVSNHTYTKAGEYVISISTSARNAVITSIKPTTLLEKVEMGSGVNALSTYAFQGCSKLSTVVMSNSITKIPEYAFQNCYNLLAINIPSGVTHIYKEAFYGCGSLSIVTIPTTVTYAALSIFENCYTLSNIVIPDNLNINSGRIFANCYNLSTVGLPTISTTNVSENQFMTCCSLRTIVVPSNMSYITGYAFLNCYNLRVCDFTQHTKVPTLGNANAFNGTTRYCKIHVPAALYDQWIAATNWSQWASRIIAV